VGCMRDIGMADLKAVPEGEWFCSQGCQEVYHKVQLLLKRGPFPVPRWRPPRLCLGSGPRVTGPGMGPRLGQEGEGEGVEAERGSQADLVALSWHAVKRKHGRLPVTRSVLSKVVRLFAVRPLLLYLAPSLVLGHSLAHWLRRLPHRLRTPLWRACCQKQALGRWESCHRNAVSVVAHFVSCILHRVLCMVYCVLYELGVAGSL